MTPKERNLLQLDKIYLLLEEAERQAKAAKSLILKAAEEAEKSQSI
jgi:hypothetical protein